MKKKILLFFILIFVFTMQSKAVLKENDLNKTMSILRTELINYRTDLERRTEFLQNRQQQMIKEIITIMNKSNQNSLMLYSQKQDYVFDLTYACHEAIEQYQEFKKTVRPFNNYIAKNKNDIDRYDSLITCLSTMSTATMTEKEKTDRNVCLTLAVNIRRTLQGTSDQMAESIKIYEMVEGRLRNLNDYANKRYIDIQTSIFKNGSDNYVTILSKIKMRLMMTQLAISEKYKPIKSSQWDSRIIFGLFLIILVYALISIFINIILIRWLLTKLMKKNKFSKEMQESFFAKRPCIIMGMTVVTFAFILGIVRFTMNQNFIIMASDLLMNYAWLLGVILISLLLRVDGTQIKSSFRIYTPLILISFIVITFRIILIPNELVNLVFPPILLLCTLWQWNVINRHNQNIPKSDVFYTYITLAVFVISSISSWIGYTLLSVQMLIWWVMQLTCILTITCMAGWLQGYAKHRHYGLLPVTNTWFYRLISNVLLPTLGVVSIFVSIYWAADIFNMSDTTWQIFNTNFVNTPSIRISIVNISMVIILFFFFRYLNNTIKEMIFLYFDKSDHVTAESKNLMARKVVQILMWGIWLLISLSLFNVSNTWLVVISGGLSTGLGIASKDILENIYYGISLMAGRIKIGDYIECDGTRGKVSSVSYTSTTIDTVYGSVIAFQNSQLFTKNYKNMTCNHGYELDVLEVGVAYGTDIDKVRVILTEAIMKMDCIYKERGVKIVLKSFADSSMILKILVWVPVLTQYTNDGQVMECVYKTLNANDIEIPFPQRDIHIIHGKE